VETLQVITTILSVASCLIPLIAGYKRRASILWLYLLLSFSFDILTIIAKRGFNYSPIPLGNVYCLIEFIILSVYYYRFVKTRHVLFGSIAALLAVLYIVRLAVYGINDNNGIGLSVFALTYIVYSLWGFYRLIKDSNVENIVQSSFFIVNVAVLLGFAGKFLIYFFADYLYVHQYSALSALWMFVKILNVAVNILFAIALSNKHDE
jgi:hypothetical protein